MKIDLTAKTSAAKSFCFALSLFLFSSAFANAYRIEYVRPALKQPWYFEDPQSVAVDMDGNVYVADEHNDRVCKFNAQGVFIASWGGSDEDGGQFYQPCGIETDAKRFVYVVDGGAHRVQKFTADGDFVSSWGGFGQEDGLFYFPEGIAADGLGCVYVADSWNYRVQKFDDDGRFLGKWGSRGDGDGQFEKFSGMAVSEDILYVADRFNRRVQKFTLHGVFLESWGDEGSSPGQLGAVYGMDIDGDGRVYLADTTNHRVQVFDGQGRYLFHWGERGTGDSEFAYPEDVVVDPDGRIYVCESGNDRIQKFSSASEFMAAWASGGDGPGQFRYPSAAAMSQDGFIYIADAYNARIQKYSPDGMFLSAWGREGDREGEFSWISGLATDRQGNVYACDSGGHNIQKFNSEGAFMASWGEEGLAEGQFSEPSAVAVDQDGNVYVADAGNDRIQKLDPEGEFVLSWGERGEGSGKFRFLTGVAVDGENNVYVVDHYSAHVQKFSPEGRFLLKWGYYGDGDGEFEWISGVAVDGEDNVLVADVGGRIQKFTDDGKFLCSFGKSGGTDPGAFNALTGIAADASGNVAAADGFNNRFQVFSEEREELPDAKAVIVAGGGPYPGNNIWDGSRSCATFAYRALLYQGLDKEDIYYLSSDAESDLDGNGLADDIDGPCEPEVLEYALTEWAADADTLLLYMVDHGGDKTFRLGETSLLKAQDLDQWMDALQQIMPGVVAVVYDACRSGSFFEALRPPYGKQRILATSTRADQASIFVDQGTISFSFLFWGQFFNGDSFYESFVHAKTAISSTYPQNPSIDADGDGVPEEKEDFSAAAEFSLGRQIRTAGDLPYIGTVTAAWTDSGETSATITAQDVIDADGVASVWAVVVPPDYRSPASDMPVGDLPKVELSPAGEHLYQGDWDGFGSPGEYRFTVFAMDAGSAISLPETVALSADGPIRRTYFPHVASHDAWETEIAAINKSPDQVAQGVFVPYGEDGDPIGDPLEADLCPGCRRQIDVGQEFERPEDIRYIVLESEGGEIEGYTKFFIPGKYRVAVPATDETCRGSLFVTHVASDEHWATGLALLNVSSFVKRLEIRFDSGAVREISLGPGRHKAFTVRELFDGQPCPDIRTAVIENAFGVVGLELFASGNQLSGISLSGEAAETIYYPDVFQSPGWNTGVSVFNPSSNPRDISILSYSAEGELLTVADDSIPPMGKYIGAVSRLVFPQNTAWFELAASGPVAGFALFADGTRLAGYSGTSIETQSGVFPKIDAEGWTRIAFANTEDELASVSLEALDDQGTVVARKTLSLSPKANLAAAPEEIFGQSLENATHIRFASDRQVAGFQLNGSSDAYMADGLPGM